MKTVLITGASTGLGLALAKTLQPKPYRLILTAREKSLPRFQTANMLEDERLWIRSLDVTNPEERNRLITEINRRIGGVDILINNAGVAYRSVVEHVQDNERLAQMDINFLGPMEMIRLVLPYMRQQRNGRIINVSSVAGMMAMPTMAVYSASKFALEGATEALFYEVRPWNIKVSLVQPGFIHSTSFQKVHYTELSCLSSDSDLDPYHQHYESMAPFIERLMKKSIATPEKVARRIARIIEQRHPKLREAVTPDARMFYVLRRMLPRRLYHWILYRSLPNIKTWG